jgi:uncharacterized protein YecT (DUF1311 family)
VPTRSNTKVAAIKPSNWCRGGRERNPRSQQIQQRLGNDAGAKQRLVAAQRVWVAFRDAECRFAAFDSESGREYSAFPLAYNECLENLTTKRIGDFKSYLTCGDKDDVKRSVSAGK